MSARKIIAREIGHISRIWMRENQWCTNSQMSFRPEFDGVLQDFLTP